MRWQTFVAPGIVALGLTAAGCGGGTDSGTSSTTTTNASAAGIWAGTDSASGLELIGLVDSAGNADFIRFDGVQFVGTVQVSGTSLALAVDGFAQFGLPFADASTSGVGTLSGTVATASTISGTLSFTTSGNTATTSTWSLTFNGLYDTASSLSAISGVYTDAAAFAGAADPMNGASVTIATDGSITGLNANTGCALKGTVTLANASYDIYTVSYALSGCTGDFTPLNDVASFSGLAEINATVSPATVTIGVTGQSSAGDYGLVSTLTAS
jgi:hypothetical protein